MAFAVGVDETAQIDLVVMPSIYARSTAFFEQRPVRVLPGQDGQGRFLSCQPAAAAEHGFHAEFTIKRYTVDHKEG